MVKQKKRSKKYHRNNNTTKIVITIDKKYAEYLMKHLPKEHPKTKSKIKIVKRRRR